MTSTQPNPGAAPGPATGTGGEMTLMEHLIELRKRIVICAVAVVVCSIVAWWQAIPFIEALKQPLCEASPDFALLAAEAEDAGENADSASCPLFTTNVLGEFNTRLRIAGYGGLVLALPVILWQLWAFISPGLYRHERKYGLIVVGASSVLFALGAALGFWAIPRALEFLLGVLGDDLFLLPDPDKYVVFVVYMMAAFGAGFLFPVVLVGIQALGLVGPQTLASGRRYAAVGIITLAAIITPSGDPLTLLILSGPMYLFYEASILIGKFLRRRNQARSAGPGPVEEQIPG